MSKYRYNNLSSFLDNWQNNAKYFDMLKLMAQLSKLFSESKIPYLDYRLAENLFANIMTQKMMLDLALHMMPELRILG